MSFRKIHLELCNYVLKGGTRTLIIEGWRMKVGGPLSWWLGVEERVDMCHCSSCCSNKMLRHGRGVHPTWVKSFTETLGSGFGVLSTRAKSEEDFDSY